MVDKRKEHELLVFLVKQFERRGGVIQLIPEGKRGKCLPRKDPPKPSLPKNPSGARCKICDWSPTNSQSISNPEIAEYGGNKVVIDALTGDMLCLVCLSAAARMNRDFKIEVDPGYGQSRYLLNNEALEFLKSESYMGEVKGTMPIINIYSGRLQEGARRVGSYHAEG